MNVGEARVRGLLEGTKQYVVPLFQRPYCWGNKEWRSLWEDIVSLYSTEDDYTHFIGAVVTVPIPTLPAGVTKYLLIDGQQRLVTIMILLSVLRDSDSTDRQVLKQEIQENYLTNRFFEDEDYLRVLPTQGDREPFAAIIRQQPHDPHSSLTLAYRFFLARVKEKVLDLDEEFDFRKLFSLIVGRINTVQIVLDQQDNPQLIFESLNGKGTPLTDADLIRNFVFMRIDKADQQLSYHNDWFPMEQRLVQRRGRRQYYSVLTPFMRHLVMQRGVMVRKEDTYVKFQQYLERPGASPAKDELVEIAKSSELYLRLIKPETEPNPELRQRFQSVLDLEVTTCHPLALRLYHLHRDERLSLESFLRCIDSIESFMVRRVFGSRSTRPLGRIFVTVCRDLVEDDLPQSILRLLDGAGWPEDVEFENGFLNAPIYYLDQKKTKFVLIRLEGTLGGPRPDTLHGLETEHIFPQLPSPAWHEHLGHQGVAEAMPAIHRIGNLTLSEVNAAMSNRWFTEKKTFLAMSDLRLNKHFEDCESWGYQEITERGMALFKVARKIWPKQLGG
ncbi:MAG: DUF262 domain-containing protein [Verrucomicrobiota bacterium]